MPTHQRQRIDQRRLRFGVPGCVPDRQITALSEYAGLADDTAADVRARCHIVKQKRIPGVFRIETPTSLIQVDSARNTGSMERALNGAFIGMMTWLVEDYKMDTKEAYLHFTVNPELIIHTYQFVGSAFYAVGIEFPKKYL
jgi:amidase